MRRGSCRRLDRNHQHQREKRQCEDCERHPEQPG
jgi:hypothetical protein